MLFDGIRRPIGTTFILPGTAHIVFYMELDGWIFAGAVKSIEVRVRYGEECCKEKAAATPSSPSHSVNDVNQTFAFYPEEHVLESLNTLLDPLTRLTD